MLPYDTVQCVVPVPDVADCSLFGTGGGTSSFNSGEGSPGGGGDTGCCEGGELGGREVVGGG